MTDKNVMSIIEGKFFIKQLEGDLGTDFLMVIPYNLYNLGNVVEVRIGAFYGRFNGADKLTSFTYLGDTKISATELTSDEIKNNVDSISKELKVMCEEKYNNESETKELFNYNPDLFDNDLKWDDESIIKSAPYYPYFEDFFNEVEKGIKQKTLKDFFERCRRLNSDLMSQFSKD